MSLHARLDALEAAVASLLPPGRCDTCGYPAAELLPILLLGEGEALKRCDTCGRLVDDAGHSVATVWAGLPVPAEVIELHPRGAPVPLPLGDA